MIYGDSGQYIANPATCADLVLILEREVTSPARVCLYDVGDGRSTAAVMGTLAIYQ
jgi:hypothetical protein